MNPNYNPNGPKSAKFKVAFTGTNSSGKTTMAMEVCARLKKDYHQLAELVSSQDRKVTWKDEHFPSDPRGHFGMISNLVNAEVQAELKGDANIVVTDRSVFDLYAIAKTDFPDHAWVDGMEGYIMSWLNSYDRIYYLPPLEYQEDGKRPPNEFRMQTHATLLRLIDKYNPPNIVKMPRSECFADILKLIGVTKQAPVIAYDEKWQAIADNLGVTLAVKHPKWMATSDVDVWVLAESFAQIIDVDLLGSAVKAKDFYFGNQIDAQFMGSPLAALDVISARHSVEVYTPSVK